MSAKPVTPARITASPKPSVGAASPGLGDDKYLAYMKAVRAARQKGKNGLASAPQSTQPVPSPRAGVVVAEKAAAFAGRSAKRAALSKGSSSSYGETPGGKGPVARPGNRDRQDAPSRAQEESDSSDSIDFEVRSLGHVRSISRHFGSGPANPDQEPSHQRHSRKSNSAKKALEFPGSSQESLLSASTGGGTRNKEMGRGKGVVLEADVGFKDGKGKGPFSPTSGSHPASHVDESSQVETSKKIAELENLRKVLDEKRTPKGQGTDGSRFNSAKEELKAQLSSIKASLAASQDGHESTEDTGAMQTKVRSQLDKLYQNEDDTQSGDDDDDEEISSPVQPQSTGEIQSPPWSSKREQLKAKLQSYQAQLRIAQSQGIARRLGDEDGDDDRDSEEETGGENTAADERAKKLQDDIQRSLENIKRIEESKATDADGSIKGSAAPLSDAPHEAKEGKGSSSPYAGVYPPSDNFDEAPGTILSTSKGRVSPIPLKNRFSQDAPSRNENGSYVDEEDPVMIAAENLRQAYSFAGYFAGSMLMFAFLCFIFGIFMPWGFSVWAIALPLGLASGHFLRYCYPLPASDGDATMPQSLAWVSIAVVCVGCFLFMAGILSASASLAIAPLISTPICDGVIPPPLNVTEIAVNETTQVPSLKNSSKPQKPVSTSHPLSGLDPATLMKLGSCQGWNMCGSEGIKMLSCSELKGFNDWNAIFFFFSSIIIPMVWFWIYYTITVRLQEEENVAKTGVSEVLDCSLPACLERIKEYLSSLADNDEVPDNEDESGWDEESGPGRTKSDNDGPQRIGSGNRRV